MKLHAPLRRSRRFWPQKVRTRLTLLYAALFFVAGSALLGLTYGLVASSLPTSSGSSGYTKQQLAKLTIACSKPNKPDRGTLAQCRKTFDAGNTAGSDSQRQRALNSLLLVSLVGLGVMTVASGGLGWVMSGRVLRPVRVITETARRASEPLAQVLLGCPTTPCPRCSSHSGAWKGAPAPARASGSVCPSPGRWPPRTGRPSRPAPSRRAALT
jgi:hypothetical protein